MSNGNQQSPEAMVANLGNLTAGMLEGEGGGDALQGYEAMQQQQTQAGGVPVMPVSAPQPKRGGGQDTSRTASSPVVPQSKLSEIFLRYGPEKDPNFIVSLFKLYPLKHAGDGGWVEDFHYPIGEKDIRDRYPEGGRFQVVIKGSHPRTQQPGHVKEQVIVDVANTPQTTSGTARRRRGIYDDVVGDNGAGYPYGGRRRPGMPPTPAPTPQVTVQPDNSATTMAFETLRDVLSSRTSGKDEMITQLRGLLDQPGRSGLDPSTVQSLIDANEAQKAAIASRHESQMTEERERATRDLERATSRLERQLDDERAGRNRGEEDSRRREEQIRERFEREVTLLRTQLDDERSTNQRQVDRTDDNHRDTIKRLETQYQAQLERLSGETRISTERTSSEAKTMVDRATDDAKQSVERLTTDHRSEVLRLTNAHAEEMKRVRHDLESRVELAERSKDEAIKLLERSKEDALAIERDRAQMLVEQVTGNAKVQMESVTNQAATSTDHMRQMSEINTEVQKASATTLQQNLEFQLQREQEDRRRAELDVRKFRDKAEEAHDPISSLSKYKEVVDTVGSFFGGNEDTAIVPHAGDEKDTSIWGRVESLMDSRFGQRAGEMAGAVFGSMVQRQQMAAQGQGMPQPGPQMQQPGPQMQQPMPQQMQQPMPPTPRQMPQPGVPQPSMTPQSIPMPQPPPGPQPGPTAGPAPTAAEVEAQIEEALYGGPAGTQTGAPAAPDPQPPQGPQPTTAHPAMQGGTKLEPINAPNALDNALLRVKMWVASIEEHIENGTPPERVVETLGNELPDEAIQGFTQFPVEVVIQEVLSNGIETRGIINSERGVAYLTEVQALLRKRAVPK